MHRQTLTFADNTVLQRWGMFSKMHYNILSLKQEETEELEQDASVKSGCRFCLVCFFGGLWEWGVGFFGFVGVLFSWFVFVCFFFEGIEGYTFQGRSMLGSSPEIVSSVP